MTDAELDMIEEQARNRVHDAPLHTEYPIDAMAATITALRARIAEDQAQIVALTTYKENLRDEVVELRARIAELEARLEIDPAYPYDGIAARDATIEGLQGQIAELEKDLSQG